MQIPCRQIFTNYFVQLLSSPGIFIFSIHPWTPRIRIPVQQDQSLLPKVIILYPSYSSTYSSTFDPPSTPSLNIPLHIQNSTSRPRPSASVVFNTQTIINPQNPILHPLNTPPLSSTHILHVVPTTPLYSPTRTVVFSGAE